MTKERTTIMSLQPIREEIDRIDEQIISLFVHRMEQSRKVAAYKQEHGMEIFNPRREEEVLCSVEEKAGPYGAQARLLYATIMELSRGVQHDLIGSGAVLYNRIRSARRDVPFDSEDVRVACFGVPGTYAHRAALKIFPKAQPVFYSPFRSVFEALAAGEADFGVIPIENSSAGSVTAVYDLMLQYRFTIAASAEIHIDHCLAASEGASVELLSDVYSHEQALAQCSDFLSSHPRLTAHTAVSTAQAAKAVAESGDPHLAAICSEEAAKEYGLRVLQRGFQNNPNNTTRFIVISREMYLPPQADKISLCFSLPHVTGSLYSILCRFASHGLNLTKIESRPIFGSSFEYFFYLDFTGSVENPSTLRLLRALSDEMTSFSFLGNYSSHE